MDDIVCKKIRGPGGQTFVETMFWLAFLFMLVFFVSEVSGLWFVNNSLNNAARLGARFAAVQPNLMQPQNINKVKAKVADTLGRDDAVVFVTISGDTVTVKVTAPFSTFLLTPFLGSSERWNEVEKRWVAITELSSEASMRYEY